MLFSGINLLSLPASNTFNFLLQNIAINNTGQYLFNFLTQSGTHSLTFNSGIIIGFDNKSHVGTYNTGQSFLISGCKTYWIDGVTDRWYLTFNNSSVMDYHVTPHDLLSGLQLIVPNGGTLECDFELYANPVNYNFSIVPSFNLDSSFSGTLTSDTTTWIYGSNTIFYSSFEQSLLINPLIVRLQANTPYYVPISDNDTNPQNILVEGLITLYTSQGGVSIPFESIRTGIFTQNIYNYRRLDSGNVIQGLFNGLWSGTQFVYEDRPQSKTFSYAFDTINGCGCRQQTPLSLSYSPNSPTGYTGNYTASYVTGFKLTNSGTYLQIPTASFTSYYMVTGINQSSHSMLFSSGCTGNLLVTFTSVGGANASGLLITTPVIFSGIYTGIQATFYTVSNYSGISGGTGYTGIPQAVVHTGFFSNCYDVPAYFGYNVAWFQSFNTQGALSPLASFLTGEVLYTTGIVSGNSLTGYFVTGLEITNIGSGYNSVYYPYVYFNRQSGDNLITGATGTFSMSQSGFYNFTGDWLFEYSIDGYNYNTITNYTNTNVVLQPLNFTLNTRFSYSGLSNTAPVSITFKLTHPTGQWVEYVTGLKYYDTSTGFFFQVANTSATGTYSPGQQLSFLFNQAELDTFYSSAAFTNNTWNLAIGDLDF